MTPAPSLSLTVTIAPRLTHGRILELAFCTVSPHIAPVRSRFRRLASAPQLPNTLVNQNTCFRTSSSPLHSFIQLICVDSPANCLSYLYTLAHFTRRLATIWPTFEQCPLRHSALLLSIINLKHFGYDIHTNLYKFEEVANESTFT